MTSYWLAEPAERLVSSPLGGRPDVVVIGAGVTGCACALALAEGGVRVRVHEARRVASGATGRSGGFALRGGGMPYHSARRELWRFTERYLDRMEELAGDSFRRSGSLRLADADELDDVRAEFEALHEDGFDAEWVERLEPPLDGLFLGAIRHLTD